MNAEELTAALAGRWRGSSGSAKCPAHEDSTPSLSISDGAGGTLLTHCFAGCSHADVWNALVDRGLAGRAGDRPAARPPRSRPRPPEPSPNQRSALEIWRATRPAASGLRHPS